MSVPSRGSCKVHDKARLIVVARNHDNIDAPMLNRHAKHRLSYEALLSNTQRAMVKRLKDSLRRMASSGDPHGDEADDSHWQAMEHNFLPGYMSDEGDSLLASLVLMVQHRRDNSAVSSKFAGQDDGFYEECRQELLWAASADGIVRIPGSQSESAARVYRQEQCHTSLPKLLQYMLRAGRAEEGWMQRFESDGSGVRAVVNTYETIGTAVPKKLAAKSNGASGELRCKVLRLHTFVSEHDMTQAFEKFFRSERHNVLVLQVMQVPQNSYTRRMLALQQLEVVRARASKYAATVRRAAGASKVEPVKDAADDAASDGAGEEKDGDGESDLDGAAPEHSLSCNGAGHGCDSDSESDSACDSDSETNFDTDMLGNISKHVIIVNHYQKGTPVAHHSSWFPFNSSWPMVFLDCLSTSASHNTGSGTPALQLHSQGSLLDALRQGDDDEASLPSSQTEDSKTSSEASKLTPIGRLVEAAAIDAVSELLLSGSGSDVKRRLADLSTLLSIDTVARAVEFIVAAALGATKVKQWQRTVADNPSMLQRHGTYRQAMAAKLLHDVAAVVAQVLFHVEKCGAAAAALQAVSMLEHDPRGARATLDLWATLLRRGLPLFAHDGTPPGKDDKSGADLWRRTLMRRTHHSAALQPQPRYKFPFFAAVAPELVLVAEQALSSSTNQCEGGCWHALTEAYNSSVVMRHVRTVMRDSVALHKLFADDLCNFGLSQRAVTSRGACIQPGGSPWSWVLQAVAASSSAKPLGGRTMLGATAAFVQNRELVRSLGALHDVAPSLLAKASPLAQRWMPVDGFNVHVSVFLVPCGNAQHDMMCRVYEGSRHAMAEIRVPHEKWHRVTEVMFPHACVVAHGQQKGAELNMVIVARRLKKSAKSHM